MNDQKFQHNETGFNPISTEQSFPKQSLKLMTNLYFKDLLFLAQRHTRDPGCAGPIGSRY